VLDKSIKLFILWISIFLVQLGIWLLRKFGEVSFDQFIFHLNMSLDGLTQGDPKLISSFIRNCLLVPTACVVIVIFLFKYYSQSVIKRLNRYAFLVILLSGSFIFLLYKVAFFTAANAYLYYVNTGEDYFKMHYVNPKHVPISSVQKPKNLVLIYVESLEDTYADPELFSHNLISSIESSSVNSSYHFSDYQQAPGTGWTIAGIVSTQCGLPLRTFLRNASGDNATGFLNNAVCLGDTLADKGYQNIFMNGADLSFAGKGKFIAKHGYTQNYGRAEWYKQNKTQNDMNDWGLYDDLLFLEAQKKLDELEQNSSKPFNLTLLTVDTHPPKGFLSHHCATQHGVTENNFEGIVECTALQVKDFVNHIRSKGYLKNTTVVVLGDHLGMKNPVYKKLESSNKRRIFNLFITEDKLILNREDMSEFDMYPTILESLGFRINEGRLGLGYSGFGNYTDKPSLDRHEEMNKKLLGYSPSYSLLWNEKSVE
jgi:phosphoglycerol transferase